MLSGKLHIQLEQIRNAVWKASHSIGANAQCCPESFTFRKNGKKDSKKQAEYGSHSGKKEKQALSLILSHQMISQPVDVKTLYISNDRRTPWHQEDDPLFLFDLKRSSLGQNDG